MTARKPLSLKTVAGSATPAEVVVPLCVDGALSTEHAALESDLEEAQAADDTHRKLGDQPVGHAIAEQIRALEERMRAHTYDFVFRRIKPQVWRDLMAKHPGDPEKRERFSEAFWPVAVAACCVSPVDMADEALFERFWDVLSYGQQYQLLDGAIRANEGLIDIPFSVAASALLRTSLPNSPTASL